MDRHVDEVSGTHLAAAINIKKDISHLKPAYLLSPDVEPMAALPMPLVPYSMHVQGFTI